MKYKTPKILGKDEDGFYRGIVEQIEVSDSYDILDLCNRSRNLSIFSLFNKYKQLGQFKVRKSHNFKEGDLVVLRKRNDKVIDVIKERITINNINEVFKD